MTPSAATLPRLVRRRTGRTRRSDGSGRPSVVRPLVLLFAAGATGWLVSRSVLRVEVVGDSMAPALVAGDRLVVLRIPWVAQPSPPPGTVVAVRDPREPSRILVKRVASVDPGTGALEVRGDAPHASTDSRTFGPVARSDLVGRAIYRYVPAGRSSAAPRAAEYDRA